MINCWNNAYFWDTQNDYWLLQWWLITTSTQIPGNYDLMTWCFLTLRVQVDIGSIEQLTGMRCIMWYEGCIGYIHCVLPILSRECISACRSLLGGTGWWGPFHIFVRQMWTSSHTEGLSVVLDWSTLAMSCQAKPYRHTVHFLAAGDSLIAVVLLDSSSTPWPSCDGVLRLVYTFT